MRAGKLRHLLTINEQTLPEPDAYGERVPTWPEFGKAWGSIEPISGRELEYARSYAATVSHKIRIRYVSGLLPTHRITFRSRTFAINSILNPEERNDELVVYCTEVATATR